MSLLAYTGSIYRQTKKTFPLEAECKILIESELQVDWMGQKLWISGSFAHLVNIL